MRTVLDVVARREFRIGLNLHFNTDGRHEALRVTKNDLAVDATVVLRFKWIILT
jgi:hypothetical protein